MKMKNDQAYFTVEIIVENKFRLELLLLQVIIFILNWNKLIEAICYIETNTQFWVAHQQQEAVSCLTEKAVDVLVQFGTT
jgi:hypothetical protein